MSDFSCVCGCNAPITDASPSNVFASQNCHERFYKPHQLAEDIAYRQVWQRAVALGVQTISGSPFEEAEQ